MRTFAEYVRKRDLAEFDVSTEFMGSDREEPLGQMGKWQFATGDASTSEREDDVTKKLGELAQKAILQDPQRVMSLLNSIDDPDIQDEIRKLQNMGAFTGMKRTPRAGRHSHHDDLDTISPNTADGSGEGADSYDGGGE
jgi:hypothetical protein